MNRARVSRVVDAMLTAFGRIGQDSSWCTAPVTIGRLVDYQEFAAIARPAIIVEEPHWDDCAPETIGGGELGVADLTVKVWLIAGTDGMSSAVADELHGLAEDAYRAVREDFQLADDQPDAPVLSHYLLRASYETDADMTIETSVGVGALTFTGRIDFQTPETGA